MRDDYYELLGITSDATSKEVTRAFRKLSLKFHPDKVRGTGAAAAEEAFTLVREAYDVLSDRNARRKYDLRASWMSSHPEQVRPASTCDAAPCILKPQSSAFASTHERPSLAATMPVNRAGSWLGVGQSQCASAGKLAGWHCQPGPTERAATAGASDSRKPRGLSTSSLSASREPPPGGRPPNGFLSLKLSEGANLTGLGGGAVSYSLDSSGGMWSAGGGFGSKLSTLESSTSRGAGIKGGSLGFSRTCPAGFGFSSAQLTKAKPARKIPRLKASMYEHQSSEDDITLRPTCTSIRAP